MVTSFNPAASIHSQGGSLGLPILRGIGNPVEWLSPTSAFGVIAKIMKIALPLIGGYSLLTSLPLLGSLSVGGAVIGIALILICGCCLDKRSDADRPSVFRVPNPGYPYVYSGGADRVPSSRVSYGHVIQPAPAVVIHPPLPAGHGGPVGIGGGVGGPGTGVIYGPPAPPAPAPRHDLHYAVGSRSSNPPRHPSAAVYAPHAPQPPVVNRPAPGSGPGSGPHYAVGSR